MNAIFKTLVGAALYLPGLQVWAEVVDVQPTGFLVRNEVEINALPERVFESLIYGIGKWWDSEHTYSGDSANMSIDPRPGGCFCEHIPEHGWIEHMRVIYVSRPQALRMSGGLGPLQEGGIAGTLTWSLTAAENGTMLQQTYSVGGYYQFEFEKTGPLVGDVLNIQLMRLKAYVETGSPVPAKDSGDRGR